jgi:hypothetical protein
VTFNLEDQQDFVESRHLDISGCKSVCLALGPYRNLTTLTAATLFLHPECQVLNHAGARIYGNREVDFISDFSTERFDRFIQLAIQLSGGGRRGDFGGSIVHSHAFDPQYKMKEIYEQTGFNLVKGNIRCLFWKESLATSNLLRENQVNLGKIFSVENRLRFLMPIRNPMDCAASNILSTHSTRFKGIKNAASFNEVLQAVLNEIYWFESLRQAYPDRLFYYFEHSISKEMLFNLAKFLDLDPIEEWIDSAFAAMQCESKYIHDQEKWAFYADTVNEKFLPYPALAAQLLAFIP